MGELAEGHGGGAAKHATRFSRNAADKAEIKFSHEVVERLRDLEEAVRGKGYFDSDVLKGLQHWASGKAGTVNLALSDMVMITEETMKHIQATGNKDAKRALSAVVNEMIAGPDLPPIATVKTFRSR